MNTILFRADSSSQIGLGHIMRDLVLAMQLQKEFPYVPEQSDKCPWGTKIVFATQNLLGNVNHKIIEAGYKIVILKSHRIEELLEVIQSWHVEMLVIDHYGIDAAFEKALKDKNPTMKILSVDDTYEKHNCDILLNHNLSANEKKYKNLLPPECELRCGTKYTLLRDEFYLEKKKKKIKSKQKTFFVAMGGTDEKNLSQKILKVLSDFKNIKVNLVTTSSNKQLNSLQRYVKNKKRFTLHIDSKNIAKLMQKSNFAIVTPSVILNEVYFMQLPFIAIKTASNQDDMYEYLKRKKFLVLKRFDAKKLKQYVKALF